MAFFSGSISLSNCSSSFKYSSCLYSYRSLLIVKLIFGVLKIPDFLNSSLFFISIFKLYFLLCVFKMLQIFIKLLTYSSSSSPFVVKSFFISIIASLLIYIKFSISSFVNDDSREICLISCNCLKVL